MSLLQTYLKVMRHLTILVQRYPCICTLSDDRGSMMTAFGATGRYGITSAIAPPCWEWSIHEWKRYSRFSWKQPTTSDWLYLIGQGRVSTVRNENVCGRRYRSQLGAILHFGPLPLSGRK